MNLTHHTLISSSNPNGQTLCYGVLLIGQRFGASLGPTRNCFVCGECLTPPEGSLVLDNGWINRRGGE